MNSLILLFCRNNSCWKNGKNPFDSKAYQAFCRGITRGLRRFKKK